MPNRFQTFFRRIAGLDVPAQKSPSGGFLPFTQSAGYLGQEPPVPNAHNFIREYRSWVYTCITTIADEVAKLKLCLYRRKPNGDIEKVEKHPVLDLLHRVNTNLTQFELWSLTSTYLDIYGESFWWLIREGKSIYGLYPWLIPANMDVKTNEAGQLTGYRYRVPGKQDIIEFAPEEILHFKNFNPANPYRGMSPIQAASFAIATDREAAAWNWRYFKNNAVPGGFIVYPGNLTADQKEQIKKSWDSVHQGTDNAFRVGLLEGGMEFKETGLSQRDMDFLESRNFNRDEIFTLYKVPRALINPDASITRANAEVVNLYFFERTVEPRLMKIVAVLNEFLLPQFDTQGQLFFDYENVGPRNLEADLQWYNAGLNNGWLTANEVREYEGREPYEGGDKFRAPFNLIDVGTEPQKAVTAAGVLSKRERIKLHTTGKPSLAESLYDQALKIARNVVTSKHRTAAIETKQSADQKAAVKSAETNRELRNQLGEGLAQIKRVRVNEEMKLYEATLRKEFERQRDDVLASVSEKRAKYKKLKAVDFSFDEDEEADLFAKIFLPVVREIVKAHGEDALKILGDSGFDVNRGVREFIKREGLAFCKDINETTATRIRNAIDSGLQEGEGIESIRRRINGVFDEATTYRARMIAQTEVNRASNFGIEEGYNQSEVVEDKEWYTPLDVDDEVCVPMNGVRVGLGKSFNLPDGQTVDGPPAHPNCHCTILPVLGKSATGGEQKHIDPIRPVVIQVPVVDSELSQKVERIAEHGEQVVGKLEKLHDDLAAEAQQEQRDEQINSLSKTE